MVATGILHILPRDFARQLTTFRVDPRDRVDALARFGALFAGDLWEVYGQGWREADERRGDGRGVPRLHGRRRRRAEPDPRPGPAKPPAKAPVLLVHGAGVRANIFRAPSGRTLVDVLVDEG